MAITSVTTANAGRDEAMPPFYRRNFAAGLVHGTFFQASDAFANIHTILPSLVALLTPFAGFVGLMASLQGISQVIPQFYTAYLIDGKTKRKPWLLAIISIRFISLGILAWLIFRFGASRPQLVLGALIGLFGIFSFIGGMGTVIYADIFARAIPPRRRGRFAGSKQLLGYGLAILAGYVVEWILRQPDRFPFPLNYAIILALSAVTLAIALTGFAMIREPSVPEKRLHSSLTQTMHIARRLVQSSSNLQLLLYNRAFLTLGLTLAPFFVIYARQNLGVPAATIGIYLSLQMGGAAGSNLLWGWLSDAKGNRSVLVGTALSGAFAAFLAWFTPVSVPWLFGGVFLLLGVTLSGMRVGYSNYLWEMADEKTRPVCVALQNTLLAPLTLAPLLVGLLTTWISYSLLFASASVAWVLSLVVAVKLGEPRTDPHARCCLPESIAIS